MSSSELAERRPRTRASVVLVVRPSDRGRPRPRRPRSPGDDVRAAPGRRASPSGSGTSGMSSRVGRCIRKKWRTGPEPAALAGRSMAPPRTPRRAPGRGARPSRILERGSRSPTRCALRTKRARCRCRAGGARDGRSPTGRSSWTPSRHVRSTIAKAMRSSPRSTSTMSALRQRVRPRPRSRSASAPARTGIDGAPSCRVGDAPSAPPWGRSRTDQRERPDGEAEDRRGEPRHGRGDRDVSGRHSRSCQALGRDRRQWLSTNPSPLVVISKPCPRIEAHRLVRVERRRHRDAADVIPRLRSNDEDCARSAPWARPRRRQRATRPDGV